MTGGPDDAACHPHLPGPAPFAGRLSLTTPNPMKHPITLLSPAAGLAIGMTLSSCIVPSDGYGGSSTTVTTYQPGRRIHSLPGGYRTETISGTSYYYHDGAYYRRDSGGYVVVEAPRSSSY